MYTPGFGKDAGSAHTCFLSATGNPIDDDEKLPYDFGCEMSGAHLRSVRNLISIKCRLEVKISGST